MDATAVQALIAVNVPHPRDGLLVHQQGLDLSIAIEKLAELRKSDRQRVRAERSGKPPTPSVAIAVREPQTPETPRVAESQLIVDSGKAHAKMRVPDNWARCRDQHEVSRHAEVDVEHRIGVELPDDALAMPPNLLDPLSNQHALQGPRSVLDHVASKQSHGLHDRAPQPRVESSHDRLNLWKFGHFFMVAPRKQAIGFDLSINLR